MINYYAIQFSTLYLSVHICACICPKMMHTCILIGMDNESMLRRHNRSARNKPSALPSVPFSPLLRPFTTDTLDFVVTMKSFLYNFYLFNTRKLENLNQLTSVCQFMHRKISVNYHTEMCSIYVNPKPRAISLHLLKALIKKVEKIMTLD